MILLAFRHGLRACELCSLRWEQVDLGHSRLHVSRAKNGVPSVHPLTGTELRALRRLQREQEPGRYVFMSERGAPMSAVGFRRMMGRLRQGRQDPIPGPSAHAPPCRRVQAGKSGRRYEIASAIPRPQKYPTHGSLYRVVTRQVSRLLEGLSRTGESKQAVCIAPRRPRPPHWSSGAPARWSAVRPPRQFAAAPKQSDGPAGRSRSEQGVSDAQR